MAITQNISPKLLHPVYNDQRIVLDSTNVSEIRFRYLTDIVDEFGDSLGLLRTPPRPNGFGIIEINNIIKDYIQYEFNPTIDPSGQGPNKHFLKFNLEYGEEYTVVWNWQDSIFTAGSIMGLTTDSSIVPGGSNIPHNYQIGDLIVIDPNPGSPVLPGKWRVTDVISSTTIAINQDFVSSATFGGTSIPADLRTTQFKDLSQSGDVLLFNGALNFSDWSNYNPLDFNLTNGDAKLITTTPQEIEVNIDDYFTVNFFNNINTNADVVEIEIITPSGIETFTINNRYGTVGVGPSNVNQLLVDPVQIGDTYTIQLLNNSVSEESEIYTFKIVERNCKFKNKKIVWLDRMGGWKSFNFDLHSSKNIQSNKTVFERNNIGDYDPLTNTYTIDSQEFGDRVEHSKINESYSVNSDRLTQNQIELVEDLFTSRFVYEYENGHFIPIIITSNTYDKEDLLHRRRKLLSLTYRHSNTNNNN